MRVRLRQTDYRCIAKTAAAAFAGQQIHSIIEIATDKSESLRRSNRSTGSPKNNFPNVSRIRRTSAPSAAAGSLIKSSGTLTTTMPPASFEDCYADLAIEVSVSLEITHERCVPPLNTLSAIGCWQRSPRRSSFNTATHG